MNTKFELLSVGLLNNNHVRSVWNHVRILIDDLDSGEELDVLPPPVTLQLWRPLGRLTVVNVQVSRNWLI